MKKTKTIIFRGEYLNAKPFASNMAEVETPQGTVLFSYSTPVAAVLKDGTTLKTIVKYSRTTTCHISKWGATLGDAVTPDVFSKILFGDKS